MSKRVLMTLIVAIMAYFLGTLSNVHAEKKTKSSTETAGLEKKIDEVLKNQEEMKKMIKRIYNKV